MLSLSARVPIIRLVLLLALLAGCSSGVNAVDNKGSQDKGKGAASGSGTRARGARVAARDGLHEIPDREALGREAYEVARLQQIMPAFPTFHGAPPADPLSFGRLRQMDFHGMIQFVLGGARADEDMTLATNNINHAQRLDEDGMVEQQVIDDYVAGLLQQLTAPPPAANAAH
jgi:hypothetical protein